MKTQQIINRVDSTAHNIAKSIVRAVLKQNYVEEDISKAVNLAILRFMDNVKNAAREELKYQQINKI